MKMGYNSAVKAICQYIDTNCKQDAEGERLDVKKEIKRLELENKLLFAIGLAVFSDYETRKKKEEVMV